MAFKLHKGEINNFSTPQEMFQDNKLKSIKGILDYQSQILDLYLKTVNDSSIINKNVAFELPTGSGKTLVGLLIAEFHRRKYGRKCLYLCPTNQLVSQVCTQAKNQYGIDAISFTGRQAEYSPESKTKYLLGKAIGVTTYSSFFAVNSFFENPDILIFDDVHSSENYIIDNWSLDITRQEYPTLFLQLASLLKDSIGESGTSRLLASDPYGSDIADWIDLVPQPLLAKIEDKIKDVLRAGVEDTNLRYSFGRISDNLADCQIYLNWHSILIRPYIPPTETHAAFKNSAQRIFMSATLGKSGELERLTGCKNIQRLPTVSSWDTKGLGRRLFIFPDLSLSSKSYAEILTRLHQEASRSVIIVPSDNDAKQISQAFKATIDGIEIYNANDLIESKDKFCASKNAVVIMSNRFDGVDFPDEESRMLFIYNLPKITHLQEKFLVGKMAASLLYSERIKTRIVQAVGRCTRNASDYSVVCILGNSILTDITSSAIQSTYHPELRAEIRFGIENSTDFTCVADIVENVRLFYKRGSDWSSAEADIVDMRDQFISEGKNNALEILYAKLLEAAQIEVEIQYDIWKKDYQSAYEKSNQVIEILNAPSLSGYKCFWQYLSGCFATKLGDSKSAKQHFLQASNNNIGGVRWLSKLVNCFSSENIPNSTQDYFFDIIESLENNLLKYLYNNSFETYAKSILEGLGSFDGNTFENAHLSLGILLGYDAHNSVDTAAPDPYWIVNDNLCIVTEDKIYERNEKEIPVEHVSQASRHATWIKANVKTLNPNANIITIFVTNSSRINSSARTFASGIYYLQQKEFYDWAVKAINSLRLVRSRFHETGDAEWRTFAKEVFTSDGTDPSSFIDFVKQKKLVDL